ncbi:MAG: LpxI family protein [Alphaproteobacteria bacterium]|nr:LpxI family protein [Alphaproteobacteria bacterium]
MHSKLGIVAGGGSLPGKILDACRATGREAFILALENHAEPALVANAPHAWVRLGAIGTALQILRDNGVAELVIAGKVGRPSLADLRPDGRALRFLASGLLSGGDDALVKAVIRELEHKEGFRVIGAQDLLAGEIASLGRIGTHAPDTMAESDIARGVAVARAMGAVDLAQSVVVQQGIVLGVEAVEGTDALLERTGALRRGGPGGVLVKLPKPNQELRVDMPVIGIRTIERAASAGLRGVAVAAGATLILQRDAVIAAADQAGLFLIGLATPS